MNNEIDELCLTRPAALQRFFMREGVAEKSAIRLCQEAFGDKQRTDIHSIRKALSGYIDFMKKIVQEDEERLRIARVHLNDITDIHTSLSWRSRFIKKEKVA